MKPPEEGVGETSQIKFNHENNKGGNNHDAVCVLFVIKEI